MAASFIEMPVDGAGKKVQTWANTIGADNVHTEATTPTDSSGVEKATSGNPLRIDPTGTTVQPVDGALTNNNAAPAGTELGVMPALANAAAPSWSEGNQVLLSVDLAGNQRVKIAAGTALIGHVVTDSGSTTAVTGTVTVAGNKTNNNAAPGATNVGSLGFLANAAAPSWTEGNLVLGSVDLSGNQRVLLTAGSAVIGHVITDSGSTTAVTGNVTVVQPTASNLNAAVVGTKTNNNAAPGATNVGALTALANASAPSWTEGDLVLASVDLTGNQRVILTAGTAVIGHVITDAGSVTAATLSAETTKVIGTVRIIGNAGGIMDFAGQNASSPANALLVGMQFNTSPTTISSGNASPFQCDASGNLLVNVKAGSTGNAAASATGSAVPASADYQGINVGGTLRGLTGVNPSGSVFASQSDITSIGGSTVVSAASGIQKVGISGNAGASLDSTVGAGTAPTNALTIASLYNTTAPAPTNGQAMAQQADQSGNLLNFPGTTFKVGAAWTSATAQNTLQYPTGTATQGQLSGAPAILVQLDQTSTLSAGAVTFQGTYDNINWISLPVQQVLNAANFASLTNPYTFVASTNQAFILLSQGFIAIRANLTTAITGSGSVTPYWTVLSYLPINPVTPAGQLTVVGNLTHNNAVPGSNNVGVLPAVASSGAPTYTNNDQVLLSTDLAGSLRVNVITGSIAISNSPAVTGSLSNNNAAPGATNLGVLPSLANASDPSWTEGRQVLSSVDLSGNQRVKINVALPTGTNVIGHVIVDSGTITTVSTVTAVTAITNALPAGTNTLGAVSSVPTTSGGLTTKSASGLTNGAVAIKASAGQLYGYFFDNTENTATTFFQVYNTASGSVTVGTTTPLFSLAVPGGGSANLMGTIGIAFGTAISIAATTAFSNGSAPANTVSFTAWYA